MEHRTINQNFALIAQDLIDNEPELAYIKNSRVQIAYLESDSTKKDRDTLVHAECEKIAAKNRWAINYDFTITLFVNNNIGMTEEQIRIMLFHELLHIGVEPGPDGDEIYTIRNHDLEDFKVIINRYGTDWAEPKA